MKLGPIQIELDIALICDCPCCWNRLGRMAGLRERPYDVKQELADLAVSKGWRVDEDGTALCPECVADGCEAE